MNAIDRIDTGDFEVPTFGSTTDTADGRLIADQAAFCLMLANGGSEEIGINIAEKVSRLVRQGSLLSHAIIIEAIELPGGILTAADTPLNSGLLKGFEMPNDSLGNIKGGEEVELQSLGLTAAFSDMRDPETDMFQEEIAGMTKLVRVDDGVKLPEGGFMPIYRRALRGVIVGHEPEYLLS